MALARSGRTAGPPLCSGIAGITLGAFTSRSAARLRWKLVFPITFGVCGNCWKRHERVWKFPVVAQATVTATGPKWGRAKEGVDSLRPTGVGLGERDLETSSRTATAPGTANTRYGVKCGLIGVYLANRGVSMRRLHRSCASHSANGF